MRLFLMSIKKEIERKYLVNWDMVPNLSDIPSMFIEQHYLSSYDFGRVIIGERKYPEKDKEYFIYVQGLDNPYIEVSKEDYEALGGSRTILGADEVRIRDEDGRFYIMIKSSGTLQRDEWTLEISKLMYNTLFAATDGRLTIKERYFIDLPLGYLAELDLFEKPDGLMTVEVEFESVEGSEAFVPPAWFGEDVTEKNEYKNRNLAVFGLSKSL